MKNKNLLIISLLILIIILGSYILFNKQKTKNIVENINTSTTTANKLALCSNQYYETEYDEYGKIVIKDAWGSEKIECSPEELEPQPVVGISLCNVKRRSFRYSAGLECLQKLELPWHNTVSYVEDEDIPILSEFKNLEYFSSQECYENLFKVLCGLKKLKSINTNCDINSEDSHFLSILPSLETLFARTYDGHIDFNDIPLSIKEITLDEFDGFSAEVEDNIKNIDKLSSLTNLESFTWYHHCCDGLGYCQCPEEFKSILLEIVKHSSSIKRL